MRDVPAQFAFCDGGVLDFIAGDPVDETLVGARGVEIDNLCLLCLARVAMGIACRFERSVRYRQLKVDTLKFSVLPTY